uniref:Gamma-glutamyltransferase 1b n=1 Tax=Sphaeramia orbicularis TaxID=375764 RepID=A0A673AZQ0_9TELE
MVKKTVIVALMMLVVAAVATFVGVFFGVGKRKPPNEYFKAAVAADAGLCSEVDILIKGGSAVDAAIAAMLCTGLVNAHSMGIGGGLFLTIYNATTVHSSNSLWFSVGGLAIAVPGEIRGYEMAHRRHGKLPWKDLFQPSIDLAEKGFPLGRALSLIITICCLLHHKLLCFSEVFCGEDGDVRKENETIMFPKLAETYRKIATEGPNAFYEGQLAQNLVADIAAAGGIITMQDLQEYVAILDEEPLRVDVGEYTMVAPTAPASGPVLSLILNILKGKTVSFFSHFFIVNWSLVIFLFQSAAHLMNSSFINHIREMISSNSTHDDSYYFNVKPSSDQTGTTHVSVMDEDGLAVSATSTINQIFGGAIYSSRTGIILNNELSDFCGRCKREQPPSSMTPVILESKSGRILVIGGSGGSLITTAVALSIMNHLWLGMNLTEAISAPIVFVDSKNNVHFEPLFDKTVIDGLKAVGHKITHWKYFFNVVNAVEKEGGCISAFSDIRKMGQSAGY